MSRNRYRHTDPGGWFPVSVQTSMERKLTSGLDVHHIEVTNESSQHNVPAGSESHFKVVIVSPGFDGKNLVTRHRLVYGLLQDEIAAGVHALALHTYTVEDWAGLATGAPQSPDCLGGKAREVEA